MNNGLERWALLAQEKQMNSQVIVNSSWRTCNTHTQVEQRRTRLMEKYTIRLTTH